jgi:hypothetical protein
MSKRPRLHLYNLQMYYLDYYGYMRLTPCLNKFLYDIFFPCFNT